MATIGGVRSFAWSQILGRSPTTSWDAGPSATAREPRPSSASRVVCRARMGVIFKILGLGHTVPLQRWELGGKAGSRGKSTRHCMKGLARSCQAAGARKTRERERERERERVEQLDQLPSRRQSPGCQTPSPCQQLAGQPHPTTPVFGTQHAASRPLSPRANRQRCAPELFPSPA